MPRFAYALLFAATSLSLACSSSSGDTGTTTDSGSGTDSGAGDVGHDSVVQDTPHDNAPLQCWIGHPTDTSAQTCDTCSFDKCKDKWTAAYGTNYLSDDFTGGACVDDAKCNCTCLETDKICQEACDISQTTGCRDAKTAIDECEKTNCTTICGFDTIDSGTDGDGDTATGG
jgi:hypothetical protein